jgi:hypothetical protein
MSMAKLPIEGELDFRLEPSKQPGLEEVLTGAEVLHRPAPTPDGEVISWTQE